MRIYQCVDCGTPGELTRSGKCSTCGSDAVTLKILIPAPESASGLDRLVNRVMDLASKSEAPR